MSPASSSGQPAQRREFSRPELHVGTGLSCHIPATAESTACNSKNCEVLLCAFAEAARALTF